MPMWELCPLVFNDCEQERNHELRKQTEIGNAYFYKVYTVVSIYNAYSYEYPLTLHFSGNTSITHIGVQSKFSIWYNEKFSINENEVFLFRMDSTYTVYYRSKLLIT